MFNKIKSFFISNSDNKIYKRLYKALHNNNEAINKCVANEKKIQVLAEKRKILCEDVFSTTKEIENLNPEIMENTDEAFKKKFIDFLAVAGQNLDLIKKFANKENDVR